MMNCYDHEDAFPEANRCAGRLTKLGDTLKIAQSPNHARIVIEELKDKYQLLFDAFLEGVEYGRKNPKPEPKKEDT